MKVRRWVAITTLTVLTTALSAQILDTEKPHKLNRFGRPTSQGRLLQPQVAAYSIDSANEVQADLLEQSREAGLLTDWHLDGRFGRGQNDFSRKFAPEHEAAKQAKWATRHFERLRCELVFPGGTFVLPRELAARNGVFYANSSTYLTGSGDWNVYLESGAEATVFVDDRKVLARGPKATGVLRAKIHVESGYHSVMVKFTAQAAPFRVAILPLNSGSRRKNNTPYLQASPVSEDMMARTSATNVATRLLATSLPVAK